MCLPKCPATGKSSYSSPGMGLEWVRRVGHARRGYRQPHRAYRCPFCGWWHLTTRTYAVDPLDRKRRLAHARLRQRPHHGDPTDD